MPSSVGSAAFALALVVALAGFGVAAVVIAALAFGWECFLFYMEGQT